MRKITAMMLAMAMSVTALTACGGGAKETTAAATEAPADSTACSVSFSCGNGRHAFRG